MKKPLPDSAVLSNLLHYDAIDGQLYWRCRMSQRVKAGDRAGNLTVHGYIDVKILGVTHKAHRLIWKMLHGSDPVDEIDHVNGIRSDNRLKNLREATAAQNRQNCRARGESKGVHRLGRRWVAQIKVDGHKRHLGCFATAIEANSAYAAAAREAFGEFARAK